MVSPALKIGSGSNFTTSLFSVEKMGVRDAVKSPAGLFVLERLCDFLYVEARAESRFQRWVEIVAALPPKQT
jgi:hypothetical protein